MNLCKKKLIFTTALLKIDFCSKKALLYATPRPLYSSGDRKTGLSLCYYEFMQNR